MNQKNSGLKPEILLGKMAKKIIPILKRKEKPKWMTKETITIVNDR